MLSNIVRIILVVHWYLVHLTVCIKLNIIENEEVIAKCVVESSIKFLDSRYPVAFVPFAIINSTVVLKKIESHRLHMDINDTCVPKKTLITKATFPKTSKWEFSANMTWTTTSEAVLRKLHSAEFWPILITSRNYEHPFIDYKNYIVFIPPEDWYGPELERTPFWGFKYGHAAKYIFVLSNKPKQNGRILQGLVVDAPFSSLRDLLILVWHVNSKQVVIRNTVPYIPPHGQCGIYKELVRVNTFVKNKNGGAFVKKFDLSFNKIPDKLKCCNIEQLPNVPQLPPYTFSKPKPNGGTFKDGVDIRILKIVTDAMSDNRNCETKLPMLVVNTLQLSTQNLFLSQTPYPYHGIRYTYLVRKAGSYPRWTWFTTVFSKDLWIAFFVSLSLTALAMRFLASSKHCQTSDAYQSTTYCLMSAWALFVGLGVSNIPQNFGFRTVFFSWIAFTICVSTVFLAFTTSFLILQVKEHQIDSVDELRQEGIEVITDVLEKTKLNLDSNLSSFYFNHVEHAFIHVVNTPNTSFYSTEYYFQSYMNRLCRLIDDVPRFHKFTEYEDSNNFYGLVFIADGVLQGRMNNVLKMLVNGGIVEKIFRDVTDPTGRRILSEKPPILEYDPMDIVSLQSCFYCLLCGLSTSVLVFLVEILIKVFNKYFSKCSRKTK